MQVTLHKGVCVCTQHVCVVAAWVQLKATQNMKPIYHLVLINESLGFCKAPTYNPDCNRCYMNIKLN